MIYLDMDGVLADFDAAMLKRDIYNRNDFIHKPRSEWTEDEANLSAAVERVMAEEGFWRGIPVMKGAHALWIYCRHSGLPFSILTARPNLDGSEWVGAEKRSWAETVFDVSDDQFICCLRHEKQKYAKGNILVDDMERNCLEWEKSGGIAILHKGDWEDVLEQLDKVINGN